MVIFTKYYGKTTDMNDWQVESLTATNSPFLTKTCAAGRANNIELFMLVLDFVVNSRLKNSMEFL